MEQENESIIETQWEHLGNFSWRIYTIREGKKFSKVVQCQGQPTHEGIVLFFQQKYKEFDIEV